MTSETMTLGTATLYDRADRRRRIWAIFASSSGNLVEWFDFYAYAFTALYFARRSSPKAIKPRNFCRLRRCSRSAF